MIGLRRTATPTMLQMDMVECGPVSLGIVLAYYGRHETLIRLRELCGVSRDGCKASNILSAARTLGLNAEALKAEPEHLREMPGPFIVYWELNHFVVVERVGRDTVNINDPATGRRRVSWQEFDQSFTGIVLRFSKGPKFQPGGQRRNIWRSLGRRLTQQKPALAYLIIAMVALALLMMIAASYPGILIDRILLGGMTNWLKPLLGALSATVLVIWLIAAAQHRVLLRMQTRLAVSGSSKFVWHLFSLPMHFFGQRSRAEVGTRVFANDELALLLSGELATSIAGLLVAVLFLVLMLRYSMALTGIAVAVALGNIAALQMFAGRRTNRNRKLTRERGKLTSAIFDGLLSIESLKSMGCEVLAFTRWAGQHARILNATHDVEAGARMTRLVSPLLIAIGGAFILGLGGDKIMSGALTLGALIAFQALTHCFLEPMDNLVRMRTQINEVQSNVDRLDDVLEHPADPAMGVRSNQANQRLSGRLELRNVTFGYNRLGPAQIKDFNLVVPTGSRVAIVGASGSGKSTITRLVTGLCAPWSGEILFDGVAREELDRQVLADSLAAVDQDVVLFEDTVAENIRLWDSGISDHALVRAAEDASIHEDIMRLPGAYDFKLEESGRNFSGGQRQRIEIARALATNPRILVLDEATSALDPATEQFIAERLRRRGCTCLVIAHRLSTIRDCDEIVVLDTGVVVERGTHESLLALNGKYASLIAESASNND